MTDAVVFDAEPLVAHAFDETGADVVDEWLDKVYRKDVEGHVATPNLAELRYIIARIDSRGVADEYVTYLHDIGVESHGVDDLWLEVSDIKLEYNPSLGDAYALAAATRMDAAGKNVTLLVGADDDFDPFSEKAATSGLVERFREDAV